MAFHEPSLKLEAYDTSDISIIPFTFLNSVAFLKKKDSGPMKCILLHLAETRKAEVANLLE